MITGDYDMSYIKLDNITFRYNMEEVPVFKDFSCEIDRGRCVLFLGENGSGKTTLFRIINGLSFPAKGSYEFDGRMITKEYLDDNVNSKLFHKEIGYLFQNPDVMLFNARVYDEIAFGPRQMGLSDELVERRVNDCMKMLGISELFDRAPYHLSGGQKKKVAIAAILALNPSVLVMDEPFSGLDSKTEKWLVDFLREYKESGRTIVIATHEPAKLGGLEDMIIRLPYQEEINEK